MIGRNAVLASIVLSLAGLTPASSMAQATDQAATNTAAATEPASTEATPAESTAKSDMIVVVGADGTPEYGAQFSAWADQLKQVAESSSIEFQLIGKDATDVPDRERLEKTLKTLDSSSATPVWLVLIGHGTYARNVAKFNLRGRDVSAAELAEWLTPIKRPLVVINCASSSGPFVNRLSAPGRVVVTATKSGIEQNFSRFGKYLVEAIASPESDLDHDDEVSVQEAFVRASSEVQKFYDSEGRLATEHALLEDNGDGKGTPASMFRGARAVAVAKDGAELDGKTASRFTLAPSGKRVELTKTEWKRRAALEQALEDLRSEKSELSEEAYDQELERVLVQLAKIYRAAEKRAEAVSRDAADTKSES